MLTQVCGPAAAALSIGGNWPYLAGIVRRQQDCRPRLVSWVIWAEVMTVGSVQAFRAGQLAAGAYTAACAAGCLAILGLGWRFGDGHRPDLLDGACLCGAHAGIALMVLSILSPGLVPLGAATAVSVGTDLLAFIPTYANGLAGREPWRPYAIFAAGAALALAATDLSVMVGVIYPAYLIAADGGMAGLVLAAKAAAHQSRGRHAARPGDAQATLGRKTRRRAAPIAS